MGKKYKIPKSNPEEEPQQPSVEIPPKPSAEQLAMERAELNILRQSGTKYELKWRETHGWWFWKTTEYKSQIYDIAQPTLAVLDEISELGMQLELSEEEIVKGEMNALREVRRSVTKNAKKLARIVAMATLGETMFDISTKHGATQTKRNDKAIDSLASLIYVAAKPEQLAFMAAAITNTSGLPDFASSTRYLSARTTEPHRVESAG